MAQGNSFDASLAAPISLLPYDFPVVVHVDKSHSHCTQEVPKIACSNSSCIGLQFLSNLWITNQISCESTLAQCLLLKIKFYWNTAILIHLHAVYGCFHTIVIELGICDRGHMGYKSKIFTIRTFMGKSCQPLI